MRVTYSESGEGGEFLGPDDLFPSPALVDFVLAYGQQALDALPEGSEQVRALVEELIQAGLLERDEEGGLRLTPRMIQGMQHRALLEIFRDLRAGIREGHPSLATGRGADRADGTRLYEFGDPLSEIALLETLRNALARPGSAGGGIGLRESDFELHNLEATAEAATVILLDLSGSMIRYGRHVAAKRVALGLKGLVRRRFPLDTVDVIGFASVAEPIRDADLPLVMPRPITTREWEVRVRVPLEQARLTHPHFTNLDHALQMARSTLVRRGPSNRQIFIVTDGQPTAHLTRAREGVGQTLNLIYPPSAASEQATLAEALRCAQAGIRIASFALIEEYQTMDWVGFVERLTRLTRGVAYYCTAGDLSATLMESYLTGKRRRQTLG